MLSLSAVSVPEDSQWQKKRSKLHNILFGSHGSPSPRSGTPDNTNEQCERQGTSPRSQSEGRCQSESRSGSENRSEKEFEVRSPSSCDATTMKTELNFGTEKLLIIKTEPDEVRSPTPASHN